MAWREQNNAHTTAQPPVYYANNNLYPNAKSPTDVPTRTSRRIHDGMVLSTNFGLDTTSDDINESPYSSPYYVNGRYTSLNLVTQRGNSSSVQGTKFLLSAHDEVEDFTEEDIQTTIEMWQGKQIKFEMPYNGKIVGNTITIKNTGGCTGILSIYLSTTDGGTPIYETAVDLCKVSQDKFEHFVLRGMTPVSDKANPRGKIYVRMEIWGEIATKRSTNPFNTGRRIEIASTGVDAHYEASVALGSKNIPANREQYDYIRMPSRPCMGFVYNDFVSVPVDRISNEKTGGTVTDRGYRYDIFCVKDGTHAEMLVYDKSANQLIENQIKVDGRASQVYIAQAVGPDGKNFVYYVDGYSPLQRFEIGVWESETVVSRATKEYTDDNDEPIDVNPVLGPSLLLFHNNRLYIGGFLNDKNLFQCSTIEANGPDFTTFPYRWYVPNQSPKTMSLNPPTAVVEYTSDSIMIMGQTFFSIWTTNTAIEVTSKVKNLPQQVSTWMDSAGVLSQGDIVNYKGVVYSFDQKEGMRRYSGAKWNVIPNSIRSHFDRVDMDKPRKLWGNANRLYFNYTDKVDGKAKALMWDMEMNYQQYPWFQDVDLPFCDVRFNEGETIVGIHPDYPCIMELYAEDVWRRLDTPIVFERHTKYISLPGNMADMVVRRVHNRVMANSDKWWYFGIAADRQQLVQQRGYDYWYRIPCWATEEDENSIEDPFSVQDIYEREATVRLSLMNINIRCFSVQCKIMSKTFRAQASLLSSSFEVAPVNYL